MQKSILICPSFFGERTDGITRVADIFADVMAQVSGVSPFVLAANDHAATAPRDEGRGFGRSYLAMLWSARFSGVIPAAIRNRGGRDRAREIPLVCTHAGLSPIARVLAARYRRPYIVYLHGVEAWRPLIRRTRWGVEAADEIWGNSEYTLREFKTWNPWAKTHATRLMPLGLAHPRLGPDGHACASQGDLPFRILTVGRIASGDSHGPYRTAEDLYKGFTTVIDAVMTLRRKGVDAVLHIVGDGDARDDLERYVSETRARSAVVLEGGVSDAALSQQYADADVFVLPSEREGFGLVYVEAMANGLPCIGVDVGAVREVIVDDEGGYLVPPRDSQAIADRLFVLARNPRVYERLSSGALRRYGDHFTAEKCRERFSQGLRAVSSGDDEAGNAAQTVA